jgi:uncharacterized membrane protein
VRRAFGTVGALFATRLLAGFLYGVKRPILTFIAVSSLLLTVALVASLRAAQRSESIRSPHFGRRFEPAEGTKEEARPSPLP